MMTQVYFSCYNGLIQQKSPGQFAPGLFLKNSNNIKRLSPA